LSDDGVREVQDFMPIASSPAHPPHSLIRRVLCVRGTVEFETEIEPRFDYGRQPHEPHLHERGAIFHTPSLTLALASPRPLTVTGTGARTEFALGHGESATFALVPAIHGEKPPPFDEDAASLASPSTTRSDTGEPGFADRAIPDAGGRWSTGRH
jgi:hypothetical protein